MRKPPDEGGNDPSYLSEGTILRIVKIGERIAESPGAYLHVELDLEESEAGRRIHLKIDSGRLNGLLDRQVDAIEKVRSAFDEHLADIELQACNVQLEELEVESASLSQEVAEGIVDESLFRRVLGLLKIFGRVTSNEQVQQVINSHLPDLGAVAEEVQSHLAQ